MITTPTDPRIAEAAKAAAEKALNFCRRPRLDRDAILFDTEGYSQIIAAAMDEVVREAEDSASQFVSFQAQLAIAKSNVELAHLRALYEAIPSSAMETIKTAFYANCGPEWNIKNCRCDPDVGFQPCEYCATHRALEIGQQALAQLSARDAEVARLRAALGNTINSLRAMISAMQNVDSDERERASQERRSAIIHTNAIRQSSAAMEVALAALTPPPAEKEETKP